jgi:hypothetical protein
MDWARILAYVTGTADQELLARNEYLATENRILKDQLKGRVTPRTPSEPRLARLVIACAWGATIKVRTRFASRDNVPNARLLPH